MTRLLVTGSSGQLGSEIVRQARGRHDVVGVDALASPTTDVVLDLRDASRTRTLASEFDAIIHTASLHAPHVPVRSKQDFLDVNVSATQTLLEAASARGATFLYTSTTSVFGHALEVPGRAVWVTETLEPRPRDIYDVTKLCAEALCRLAHEEGRVRACVLRTSRFFPEAPEKIAAYRLYRGGDVRDIAAAHLLALERPPETFEVFIVSARSPFQPEDTLDLWHHPAKVVEARVPGALAALERCAFKLPEHIDRVYVIEKAERMLGYRPAFSFWDTVR